MEQIVNSEDIPSPRYRHSMCALSDDEVLLFGGVTVEHKTTELLNDMFVITVDFETFTVRTSRVEYGDGDMASIPSPRCSMTMELVRDPPVFYDDSDDSNDSDTFKVLVFGGLIHLNCCVEGICADSNVYIFDLRETTWSLLEPLNTGPLGMYGHSSCVELRGNRRSSVFMAGGLLMEYDIMRNVNVIKYNEYIWKFEVRSRLWHCVVIEQSLLEQQLNIGHQIIYFGNDQLHDILWLIGGGVNVFSFGTVHAEIVQICLPRTMPLH